MIRVNANISKSDFIIALKGAYVNLIQSLSIDVGNVNAIQNTAYVNPVAEITRGIEIYAFV